MATILDQKEEVLRIELTKHGRKLLGQGVFKPEFYSFFDDSVIYDSNYINLDEIQNDSQERILNNSIAITAINLLEDIHIPRLGDSSLNNDYAPSWNLNVLNGNILYSKNSSSYAENVFNTEPITYYWTLNGQNSTDNLSSNIINFELLDDNVLNLKEDYFLIDLVENNLEDEFENFQIEITTFDELAGGIAGGLEKKLNFTPKRTNIIDGILYDENELPNKFIQQKIDKNDVEFYLEVLVDEEIDQNIINKAAKTVQEQVKGTYTTTFEGQIGDDC
jgi:hypothetical protein